MLKKPANWFVQIVSRLDRADISIFRFLSPNAKRRFVRSITKMFPAPTQDDLLEIEGVKLSTPYTLSRRMTVISGNSPIRQTIAKYLEPGMVMVDVGANIGYHTIFAAVQVAPTGKVFAVEPAAGNLQFLHKNIHLNRLSNVIVLPIAAGSNHANMELYIRQSSGSNSLYQDRTKGEVIDVERVEVKRLDEIITESVDLIKIDVEGAEIEALKGMQGIFDRSPTVRLIVEWNPQFWPDDPCALPEYLLSQGFTFHVIGDEEQLIRTAAEAEAYATQHIGPSAHVDLLATRSAP